MELTLNVLCYILGVHTALSSSSIVTQIVGIFMMTISSIAIVLGTLK